MNSNNPRPTGGRVFSVVSQLSKQLSVAAKSGLKLLASVALFSLAAGASASGLNLEGLGIRAVGMGGAFISVADDASAIYWNPAGLSQLRGSGFSFGVYSMTPHISDRDGASNNSALDGSFDPNKGDAFPAFVATEPSNFDDHEEDWLSAATMPAFVYFKNFGRYTIAGGVYGVGGAYSTYDDSIYDPSNNAKIDADVFAILGLMAFNTSVGYQLTEKLSVGVGVDVLYSLFRVDLDKDYHDPSENPGSYEYKAKVREWGIGLQGNLGVLYRFNEKFSLGLDYKTGSSFDLEGETRVKLRGTGAPFQADEKSDSRSQFKYAPSLGIGFSYRPNSDLLFAVDVVGTDWRDFNWMGSTAVYDTPGTLLQNQDGDPKWELAYTYRAGVEWRYTDHVTLRAGYMQEDSGVPSNFENVTTTTIGDIRIFNVGAGVMYDKWKVDYLLGVMWGDNGGGVEHLCADVGIQFSRMF